MFQEIIGHLGKKIGKPNNGFSGWEHDWFNAHEGNNLPPKKTCLNHVNLLKDHKQQSKWMPD